MIFGEAIRRGAEGGWVGTLCLMLGIETAFVFLFFLEAVAFSWLGTPDATPDSVLRAEIVEFSVSSEGAQGLSILRIEHGARREAFTYSAVIHPMEAPERAAVISFGHLQPLRAVHSPVADLAVVGCDDGSLYLFQPTDQNPRPRVLGRNPRGTIYQVAFSPDGQLLLTLSNLSLNAWSIRSGDLIRSLPTAPEAFCCIAFVPDSQHVLLGDMAGSIYEWSITDPGRPKVIARCVDPVYHLACSPDGRRAVAASLNGILHTWDIESNQLLWRQPRINSGSTSPAIFSADGQAVISGLASARDERYDSVALIVRDAETGEMQRKLVGHTRRISRLAVSDDGRLHSGSCDGTIRTWDLRSGKEIRRFSAGGIAENWGLE